MNPFLRGVRQVARSLGWDVVRHNAQTNVDVRRQKLLRDLEIGCVLDIGANVGAYASGIRRFGYQGAIVSVEPTLDAFAKLAARSSRDPLWTARREAVTDFCGSCTIHVAANSVSSSLLERGARLAESCRESEYAKAEEVPATTLDRLLSDVEAGGGPIWAKLDVQGSLGRILSAANGSLEKLSALEVELPFVEMYRGEILFPELMGHLHAAGFELVSLESNTFDPVRGAVLEVNGILVRPGARGWRRV